MQISDLSRFTEVRQTINVDINCHFLGKAIYFPIKSFSLIVCTVAECSLGVFNKGVSFWNCLDAENLSEKTVAPFPESEEEFEKEKEVEEAVELNLANLNYDAKCLISNFLNYKDIISFSSISKDFYENFKDKIYRINPNHHLYQIITNLQSSKKIENQLTRYKIASSIAPILDGAGSHMSFIGVEAFLIYSRSPILFIFSITAQVFFTVLQIDKLGIESYPPRDREKEGLKEILSYPSYLNNDLILKNYLIDDKVPLLPCRYAISGKSFDFANIIISKDQSKINKHTFVFDFDSFKKIQSRVKELKPSLLLL